MTSRSRMKYDTGEALVHGSRQQVMLTLDSMTRKPTNGATRVTTTFRVDPSTQCK